MRIASASLVVVVVVVVLVVFERIHETRANDVSTKMGMTNDEGGRNESSRIPFWPPTVSGFGSQIMSNGGTEYVVNSLSWNYLWYFLQLNTHPRAPQSTIRNLFDKIFLWITKVVIQAQDPKIEQALYPTIPRVHKVTLEIYGKREALNNGGPPSPTGPNEVVGDNLFD